MIAVPTRPRASVRLAVSIRNPGAPAATTAKEYTPSPAVTSPCVPSSTSVCTPPPSGARSTDTPVTGLGGNAPGVTLTVSRTGLPATTDPGNAAPSPLGLTPRELLGDGGSDTKSAALSFVSMTPPSSRIAAVVFVSVGALPVPSKQLVVP